MIYNSKRQFFDLVNREGGTLPRFDRNTPTRNRAAVLGTGAKLRVNAAADGGKGSMPGCPLESL